MLSWQLGMRTLTERPARPVDPIPDAPHHVPVFNLDEKIFSRNVRSARKGAAGGPSGMTCDHLRPLLDSSKDTHFGEGAHPRSSASGFEVGQNDSVAQEGRRSQGHRCRRKEILSGAERSDVRQQERGWKLFMLLPRMLLCRRVHAILAQDLLWFLLLFLE